MQAMARTRETDESPQRLNNREERMRLNLCAFIEASGYTPRFVQHQPAAGDDHEIYLDHVDGIASLFSVPSSVIDSQIRRLVVTDKIASHKQLTDW